MQSLKANVFYPQTRNDMFSGVNTISYSQSVQNFHRGTNTCISFTLNFMYTCCNLYHVLVYMKGIQSQPPAHGASAFPKHHLLVPVSRGKQLSFGVCGCVWVCVGVCACVRACVRACVCVCVRVYCQTLNC